MKDYLFAYGTLAEEHAPQEIAGTVTQLRYVGQGFVFGRLYDLGEYPGAVLISARRRQGLNELLSAVEETLSADLVDIRVRIPYSATDLVNTFHRKGIVESEDYSPRGTLIEGKIPQALAREFEEYRVT